MMQLYKITYEDVYNPYSTTYYDPVLPTGKWKIKKNLNNETTLYLQVKLKGLPLYKRWIEESKLEIKHAEREYINKCI